MSRCGLGSAATQLSSLRPSSMHGGQRHRAVLSAPSHFLFASDHHTPSAVDVDVEPFNISAPPVVTIQPTLSPSTGDAIAIRGHGITAFLPARAHLRRQPSSTLPPRRRHGYLLLHVIIRAICSPSLVANHPPGITDGTILVDNGGYYITTIPINFLIQPTNKILSYHPDTHQAWFSRITQRWSIFSFLSCNSRI